MHCLHQCINLKFSENQSRNKMDGYSIMSDFYKSSLLLTYSILLMLPVKPTISFGLSIKAENNLTEEEAEFSYDTSAAVLNSSLRDVPKFTEAAEIFSSSSTPVSRTAKHQSPAHSISRVTSQLTTSQDELSDELNSGQLHAGTASLPNYKYSDLKLRLQTDNVKRKTYTGRPGQRGTAAQEIIALQEKSEEEQPAYGKSVAYPTRPTSTPPSVNRLTSIDSQQTTEPSIKRRHVESDVKILAYNSSKANSSDDDDEQYEDDEEEYEDINKKVFVVDWNGNYEANGYGEDYDANDDDRSSNYDYNGKQSQESPIFNYSGEWGKSGGYDGDHKTFVISDIHLMPRHRDTEMRRLSISLPLDDHMNNSMLVIYIWLGLLAIMLACTFVVYKYKEQLNIVWWRVTHVCRPSPPQTQADEGLLEHPLV